MVLFTLQTTKSIDKPVPKSKTPAATKSNTVRFISFVNCIATKGISIMKITVSSRN